MTNYEENDQKIHDQVSKLLKDVNRIPYLFVGSGISRRYTGNENWEDLLKWICSSVGEPLGEYRDYVQVANDIDIEGPNFPRIASKIQADFVKALSSPGLKDWSEKHDSLLSKGVPALKLYISEHLHSKPTASLDELEELRKSSREIAGIITTNYDDLLENIFPDYDCYVGQEDLLFSSPTGIGEIYKIHGSVDKPESMVFTEEDYSRYKDNQDYLLSKILTIFGEYPVIFLGYSLQDQNVRDVISSLARFAGANKAQELAKRFIFVNYSTSDRQVTEHSFDVGHGHYVTMTAISTDNFTPLYQAIGENKQLYAPKVLNQLSREVYNIAMTGKPSSTLVLDNFEHLDKLPADKPIVAAIGVNGYGKPVNPLDLYEDVLFGNKSFKPSLVVGSYLNKALGSNAGGLPMFKILSQYDGPITGNRIILEIQKHKTMDSYLSKSDLELRTRIRKQLQTKTLLGLKEHFGDKAAENILVLTQQEFTDIEELHKLLSSAAEKQLKENSIINSPLKKSIRIYDFLKYQPRFSRKWRDKKKESSHSQFQ